ncbi:MAG: hypothetical protein ABR529_10385 [Actinomycetota bacterium]
MGAAAIACGVAAAVTGVTVVGGIAGAGAAAVFGLLAAGATAAAGQSQMIATDPPRFDYQTINRADIDRPAITLAENEQEQAWQRFGKSLMTSASGLQALVETAERHDGALLTIQRLNRLGLSEQSSFMQQRLRAVAAQASAAAENAAASSKAVNTLVDLAPDVNNAWNSLKVDLERIDLRSEDYSKGRDEILRQLTSGIDQWPAYFGVVDRDLEAPFAHLDESLAWEADELLRTKDIIEGIPPYSTIILRSFAAVLGDLSFSYGSETR